VDHLNESTGEEVEVLAPFTVVYGAGSEKRISEDANWEGEQNLRDKHIEYLREILPK
jgi:dynactin-6